MTENSNIIELKDVKISFGNKLVHNGINLDVKKGEIIGIVGKSGSGKTTLMREILMLQRPDSGSVRVFGKDLMTASADTLSKIEHRWGVLFQANALFSSLTAIENIQFPLREFVDIDDAISKELALQKLASVGLEMDTADKFPSQLSGGMQKRVGLARALILEPELLFLDEPTAALDPELAAALDELILDLQEALGLTIVIVTHDLDTLWRVTDKVAFIHDGKILCYEPMKHLVKNKHKAIQEFFNGPRGRGAYEQMDTTHGNEG